MTFEQKLRQNAKIVTGALDELLSQEQSAAPQLIAAMRHGALGGGKRLRPFLVITCAQLFGIDQALSLRTASALECIHCYSLVHDDLPVMDDDDLRRGQPTVHKEFDEASAILAGDGLLTLAFEILSDQKTHPDADIRIKLINRLAMAAGSEGMVGGQMLDLQAEQAQVNFEGTIALQRLKTGALIEYACWAGGILGEAGPHDLAALEAYARNIGLAFQIADDLLDVEANSEDIGKRTGKDAKSGKATLVAGLGVDQARDKAKSLTDDAVAILERFGQRADDLREAALYITARKS